MPTREHLILKITKYGVYAMDIENAASQFADNGWSVCQLDSDGIPKSVRCLVASKHYNSSEVRAYWLSGKYRSSERVPYVPEGISNLAYGEIRIVVFCGHASCLAKLDSAALSNVSDIDPLINSMKQDVLRLNKMASSVSVAAGVDSVLTPKAPAKKKTTKKTASKTHEQNNEKHKESN
jgi:hypothetical protein